MAELNVVTGAFGFTGKYITRRLLERGQRVLTLTNHPERPNPFGEEVAVAPYDFERPEALVETLRGATTLYNTYWVRFDHGRTTFVQAVANSRALFRAAAAAGVERVVHVSITNASESSTLPYFRGKGEVEAALRQVDVSHAILRPTVVFGPEDILINNIAWLLRRFPLFPVPGSGEYRLQPVFVDDLARLAVEAGESGESVVLDAVGPEIYTFNELAERIRTAVGSRARLVHLPSGLALLLSRVVGMVVRDVILTSDEVRGLMDSLLVSADAPSGKTRLSDWLAASSHRVGERYASELARHFRA